MVWIFLAVLTVLKSLTSTLHTNMKVSSKMLPIVTSIASGEEPEKLAVWFYFFLRHKKILHRPQHDRDIHPFPVKGC